MMPVCYSVCSHAILNLSRQLSKLNVALPNKLTAYSPLPLNKATAFCCRDSSLTSSDFKCSVSAVQLTALTSDSVNRDNRCYLVPVWCLRPEQPPLVVSVLSWPTGVWNAIQAPDNNDGVAAPSTDYGLKLPVGHEGLSRVGDNALGSGRTEHTRTIPKGLGKLSLSP